MTKSWPQCKYFVQKLYKLHSEGELNNVISWKNKLEIPQFFVKVFFLCMLFMLRYHWVVAVAGWRRQCFICPPYLSCHRVSLYFTNVGRKTQFKINYLWRRIRNKHIWHASFHLPWAITQCCCTCGNIRGYYGIFIPDCTLVSWQQHKSQHRITEQYMQLRNAQGGSFCE